MNSGDIRVRDPDEIRECMQNMVVFVHQYIDTLHEDLNQFDEVQQLCEETRTIVVNKCAQLAEEKQRIAGQNPEMRSAVQGESEECLWKLERLNHYSELIDGMKRDTISALRSVQTIAEETSGIKRRVDVLMDLIVTSR